MYYEQVLPKKMAVSIKIQRTGEKQQFTTDK